MKKIAKILILLLAATSVQAIEYSWSTLGWTTDLDMYGLPSDGSRLSWGNLRFSPYLEVMYGYDSNPRFAHGNSNNEKSSTAFTATTGTTIGYHSLSQRARLSGNLYYSMDRYNKQGTSNRDAFGQQLALSHGSPSGWNFNASEGWVRAKGRDFTTGDSADRDSLNFNLGVGRSSDRSRWTYGGNAAYERTDYKGGLYNKNDGISAGLYVGRHISPKTTATLSSGYSYRTSKNTDSISQYNLQAGLQSRLLPKVTYSVSGGGNYSRASNGWNNWGASYNLSLGWKISTKLSASLYGSSWLQPSEIANSEYGTYNYVSMYNTLGGGVTYVPFRYLSTTTQALYRRGQYKYMGDYETGSLNGVVDELYMARIAANLSLTDYLSLVASAQYQFVNSDIKEKEYDEYSASLGVRLQY